jgi:kynureninase
MDSQYQSFIKTLRNGQKPEFPAGAKSIEYARQLDAQDKLSYLRENFNIPTTASLKKRVLNGTTTGMSTPARKPLRIPTDADLVPGENTSRKIPNGNSCDEKNGLGQANGDTDHTPSIYFVGNSLGAQPKCMRTHLDAHLETWASIGVNGHFTSFENSPLAAWQDMAADCAQKSLDLVGAASPSEVVYMNTLTVNLHLMMASFYRPTEKRHKIIAEWKPFPSDSVCCTPTNLPNVAD